MRAMSDVVAGLLIAVLSLPLMVFSMFYGLIDLGRPEGETSESRPRRLLAHSEPALSEAA